MIINQDSEHLDLFIATVEGLEREFNEGNIDVYEFYEEVVAIKKYIINNSK